MTDKNPQILVPEMCKTHQGLLIGQVGIPESGPWRVAIIIAQVALFQGTTAHPDTYPRLDGDVMNIGRLGCLACFRPDCFGEIVAAMQAGPEWGFDKVKALGEKWVNDAHWGPKS